VIRPTDGDAAPGTDLAPRTRAGTALLLVWLLLVNLFFYGHLARRYADRIRPVLHEIVMRLR
jgi:hypothetical protein